MSIPLVQENTKDAINTSIIAIKRNIERINSLLGLSGSEEIDTSIFATKEELEALETALQPVDEVTVDNMQSVTSNAVAESFSYSTTEQKTGGVWIDGKPIYRKVIDCGSPNDNTPIQHNITNIDTVCFYHSYMILSNSIYYPLPWRDHDTITHYYEIFVNKTQIIKLVSNSWYGSSYTIVFYTKTTD